MTTPGQTRQVPSVDKVPVRVEVLLKGGARVGKIRSDNPSMVRVQVSKDAPGKWGTENPFAPGPAEYRWWPIEIRDGKCMIEIEPMDEMFFDNLFIMDA